MKVDDVVTGIVVCHNTKDLMERAYSSIRKSHPFMDIIIIDCSNIDDDCYKYVSTLVDDYTRVFHSEDNIGHGRGVVYGLQFVTTPFVLVFDSDIEMLKSPVQQMLDMVDDDTYGVGYIEKTAFDGHEWGCKPQHLNQNWMRYLHPYFCLIQLKEYYKYQPFCHHGAPAVNTMLDIYSKGISCRVIKEFEGLGHSSGKGWVWEGEPREFIKHDTAGTRKDRTQKGLAEIEGTWDPVIQVVDRGVPDIICEKNGITVITCTGDRPEVFELCKKWMVQQQVKPEQWIVVDDGKVPLLIPDCNYVTYIRREPKQSDPKHTMIINFKEAVKYITGDKVIIMEDDEYYSPAYIKTISTLLNNYAIVGIGRNRYYHLFNNTYYEHGNMFHASLAETSFTKEFLSNVINVLNKMSVNDSFLDIKIWDIIFPGKTMQPLPVEIKENISKKWNAIIFDDNSQPLYVGMKGLPGREGIGSGHKGTGALDNGRNILKSWVNTNDFNTYISFFEGYRSNSITTLNNLNVRRPLPKIITKKRFQPVVLSRENRRFRRISS